MSALSALFIGGTGRISSACTELALAQGLEVTVLNRGKTTERAIAPGARVLTADIRDEGSVIRALGDEQFDVVADFVAFEPAHAELDIRLFSRRTAQYVFVSSASAYQKPLRQLPITESTPLRNPFWAYSRDKIACEERLMAAYRADGFPVTIVRPSHTYDRTTIPVLLGGWTVVDRMRQGLPVVVHGDGTSLWTLTHHRDFARAFVPLLGQPTAIGDVFQITSDEAQPWNQIYTTLGQAAGAEPHLVHLSSAQIAALVPEWGPGLLGDMAHSVIFDNTKVRRLVPGWHATIPWAEGAREVIEWFDAETSRRPVDPQAEAAINRLVVAATTPVPAGR
jgi:nucleoside-diphosphate-sugar epimerase